MNREDRAEVAGMVADLIVAQLECEPFLDKYGIAEHFACCTRSIETAMKNGMPHSKIFGKAKFKIAECEAWLAANGVLELRGDRGMLDGTTKCPGGAANAPGPDTRRNP